MQKTKYIKCMGYSIFRDSLDSLPPKPKLLVNTINQYSYCLAEGDKTFKIALRDSDVLLPDGIGIVLAIRLLKRKKIKKIAGADFHNHQLKRLNSVNGSCFYLGSSEMTLKKIKERMSKEYPNVHVGGYSPPYKVEFSKEDTSAMITAVNAFRPNVLFVGMTAPKQEKWSHVNKNKLQTEMICSIGAVFDFYAGTVKRPNEIWINLGLEWLGRLFKEPKRLWKRYIYYGIIFGRHLLRKKRRKLMRRKKTF